MKELVKKCECDGIVYDGVIYTDHKEYAKHLAEIHGKTQVEVLDAIVQGYQALGQLARTAQSLAKKGDLKPGMRVEVTALYGIRGSQGEPTKADIALATQLLKEAGVEKPTNDQIAKASAKVRENRIETERKQRENAKKVITDLLG